MLKQLPKLLLPWYREHKRDLPWRRDTEPYHIWLSEIMLQQTRVEAVKGDYARFLQKLPTVEALAEADENELLKLWEGLGYYTRVRNLQKAAKQIVEMGEFPTEHKKVLELKGVGAYTAGAICSICFGMPTPAVDGNVLRVLSRLLAQNVDAKQANALLVPVYPEGNCGEFTQALMELGATVCIPNGAPLCESCPLYAHCEARKQNLQSQFPVKSKKKPRRVEHRTVFVLTCGEKLAVCKRPNSGLLAGLWQLPDVSGELTAEQAIAEAEAWGVHPIAIEKTVQRQHIFTHVQWELTGVYLRCAEETRFTWVTEAERESQIGLPTAYRQFLDL